LALDYNWLNSLPNNIFDAYNCYEDQIFLNLTPLIWNTIDLLISNRDCSEIILGELVDSLMDATRRRWRDQLDLFVLIDIIAAVGQQESRRTFDE